MPSEGVALSALAVVAGGRLTSRADPPISDVTHDSRQAGPGVLFVAIRGFRADGHDYAAAAVQAGAPAVVVERPLELDVPQVVVSNGRSALGRLAAEVHGHPAHRLELVGVTGTNGKTTVTHMIEAIAGAAGKRAAVIGTIGVRIAGRAVESVRTTPEASDLQRLLAEMVDAGIEVAAVEASSHALALDRLVGTRFQVVAFTNLSQDHLDFHADLDDYFAAKAKLFEPSFGGRAVIWVDDPWGERLAATTTLPVTRVGLSAAAEITATDLDLDVRAASFTLQTPDGAVPVSLPLGGRFNVANALIAAACSLAVGCDLAAIAHGLSELPLVPGRFEPIDLGQRFTVVVDYAHTPAGIDEVIAAVREVTSGRITVVVGAGGDRDRDKRSLMGRAASAADLTIFTSDNPRSEDPAAILADLRSGADPTAMVVEEPDRRRAIRTALGGAAPGDVVLVLGKGHEQGQQVGDVVLPFDDRTVVREELAARLEREPA